MVFGKRNARELRVLFPARAFRNAIMCLPKHHSAFFVPVVRLMALAWVLSLVAVPPFARAQEAGGAEYEDSVDPTRGFGGQILLTNSGFGLGGYYSRALGRNVTFVFEISLSTAKDEREVAFFDRFGRKDLPNKANYLLMFPVQLGIEKRLFRETIEDNFRPFFHVTAGPTIGWKYPYFSDDNENGMLDDGEKTYDAISSLPKGSIEMGVGGSLAVGAYFGSMAGITQSVRVGYTFTHFFDSIELLDRTIREPSHFFGSPTILVSFGKLF